MISIREKNFNIEEYLNSLPKNITKIDVSNMRITYLPELTRFTELRELHCEFNELTSLPDLPENLVVLNCTKNKLTSLPELPNKLERLYCHCNKLRNIPDLSKKF
jgi:Leucine-rich repeat (LRR) protein